MCNSSYLVAVRKAKWKKLLTIVVKSEDRNRLYFDIYSNDYYDVTDFDFSYYEIENSVTTVDQRLGMVIDVCVEEGTTVRKGDVLLVIKSMKM